MAYLDNDGVTRLTTDLKDRLAPIDHDHAASDITSGELAIARGGTGAGTAAAARANLEVVKDSAIAYVESTTATANHAVGDYFMLGNVLMRATAAIAAGETINASKATPATVQSQIDTLRDSVDKGCGTEISDLNTIFDNISTNQTLVVNHYVGTSVLNRPANGSGVVWTFKDVATFGWQVAVQNGTVYTRYLRSGTLEAWRTLAFS